jgi:hypothetical protein
MSAHIDFYSNIEAGDNAAVFLRLYGAITRSEYVEPHRVVIFDQITGERREINLRSLDRETAHRGLSLTGMIDAAMQTVNWESTMVSFDYGIYRSDGVEKPYEVIEEINFGKIFLRLPSTLFSSSVNFRLLSGNAKDYLRSKKDINQRNIDFLAEDIGLAAHSGCIEFGVGAYNDYPKSIDDLCVVGYRDVSRLTNFFGIELPCTENDIADIVSMTDYMKHKRIDDFSVIYACNLQSGQFKRLVNDIQLWL